MRPVYRYTTVCQIYLFILCTVKRLCTIFVTLEVIQSAIYSLDQSTTSRELLTVAPVVDESTQYAMNVNNGHERRLTKGNHCGLFALRLRITRLMI